MASEHEPWIGMIRMLAYISIYQPTREQAMSALCISRATFARRVKVLRDFGAAIPVDDQHRYQVLDWGIFDQAKSLQWYIRDKEQNQ